VSRVGRLAVSESLFFVCVDGSLVAWDFAAHRQFVLSPTAVRALIDIGFREQNPGVCEVLERSQILQEPSSAKEPAWGWDLLSKIFHVGTSCSPPESFGAERGVDSWAYLKYCESILAAMPSDAFSTVRGREQVSHEVTPRRGELFDLLARRETTRRFTGEEIEFHELFCVLDETFRYRSHNLSAYKAMGMSTPTKRRSSPSGGSLQSCEAYVLARKVRGLKPGVYHYRSHTRVLGVVRELPLDFGFGKTFGGQMFAADLSAAIVVTCRFDKMMWKYRQSRSYRVALLDAGHLSQTAQLVATHLDIRTWVTAAFFEDELRSLLGVDQTAHEYPLVAVGLGTGDVCPFDRDLGDGVRVGGD